MSNKPCNLQQLVLLMWTFFSSIVFINDCRELSGYKFPVYTTSSCPRNEIEYQVRSTSINCSETNLYMCVPNENLTHLCEFCYHEPVALSSGLCLYLDHQSIVESYDCRHFVDGCPDLWSYNHGVYKYPMCSEISNGCFLADPSCVIFATRKPPDDKSKFRMNITVIFSVICGVVFIFFLTCMCKNKSSCGKKFFRVLSHRKRENKETDINTMQSIMENSF
ncbi:uncharacterized protein LOC144621908 [Crassostrea virginica]